ncbi:MAG TPA: recombination protein O N-terminal domain-containing protein, partial [Oxalicibacterium sp.]|nr:recombination protein O N-terminal domain-containing protein [Oxalicibacterium sp.]
MAALPADVPVLSAAADDDASAAQGTAPAPAAKPARRSRATEKETRVVEQPGFVLHSYPYKETSLIVDVFSRDHGRVALVAKGAKRPHSKLRG